MSDIIYSVVLGVYMVASLGFLANVLFQRQSLLHWAYRLTLLGLTIQTAFLGVHLLGNGYPFIYSDGDAYGIIAWAVTALFLILSRTYRFKAAGVFLMPTAICFVVISWFDSGGYEFGTATSASPWVVIHLFFAFLAFASFLVSFMIGIAFILVETRIKAKNLGVLVRKLPPLEILDGIHYKALGLGLILLTAAIIAGSLLNKDVKGVFISQDPKQLWILCTWFLYAAFLELRRRIGWRGRRGIILSVLGFIIVVLGYFGLQHGGGV